MPIIYVVVVIALLLALTHILSFQKNQNQVYGVSFSQEYAIYLGLDPRFIYKKILDDLGFKYVRLSAQWNDIEKERGKFDFSTLDWYMNEAAARKAKVVLAVGQKIPRWPECHSPEWTSSLSDNAYFAALREFVKITVERYKNHPALEIWQVENEPLLKYGVCRPIGFDRLRDEINFVFETDPNHGTMVTESGELNLWNRAPKLAHYFGTTMYRVVWNKVFGYFSYNWMPPLYYKAKLWLSGHDPDYTFISELQAEPWIPNSTVKDTPLSEQYRSMSIIQFQKNIDYAKRVGFPRAYLWGAEWWYWMKDVKGVSDYVDFAKTLKKK